MTQSVSTAEQQREISHQVDSLLSNSASFNALSADEREQIRRDTKEVVSALVSNQLALTQTNGNGDPYAVPMGPTGGGQMPLGGTGNQGSQGSKIDPSKFTGGATKPGQKANFGPTKIGDFGTGIAMGVAQTGQLLREVNFPAFVAELIQGVFQAVVDASVQQMKAYGELVQSVTMSLNDFRDQNVTENQARDHLVSKYPTLMQVNIGKDGPRVGPRPGADGAELPNFRAELGLDEDVDDLDPELIEEKLVPAARNDLAKQRQSLLATMLLMGINRIIVTDGKINAKLRFDFRARDKQTTYAQEFDYENFGQMTVEQHEYDRGEETGEGYKESKHRGWFGTGGSRSGESNRWQRGTDQITTAPVIYLTQQKDTQTEAEISAEGQLRSDVTLNFKSETFDLNKLASADEIFKLERVRDQRAAGRGVPAAGAPAAAAPGTTTAPAATPPATTQAPAPAA